MKGYPIPVKGQYTCNSMNVIYILKCPCGKCYVRQTSRSIKVRVNEHRSCICTYQNRSNEEKENADKFGEIS